MVGDLSALLIDADDRQVFHLKRSGRYEPESLQAWADMIQYGDTVLDVGAYTGLYSILAAKKGATVYALEPMPANAWRCSCNFDLNQYPGNIKLLRTAASDEMGIVSLHYNRRVPLTTGGSINGRGSMHNETMDVPTIKIDALALTTKVSAMKIDVERHERAVIKGAIRLIERDRPKLLIETLDAEMSEDLLKLLPGYDAAATLDGRNTLYVPCQS